MYILFFLHFWLPLFTFQFNIFNFISAFLTILEPFSLVDIFAILPDFYVWLAYANTSLKTALNGNYTIGRRMVFLQDFRYDFVEYAFWGCLFGLIDSHTSHRQTVFPLYEAWYVCYRILEEVAWGNTSISGNPLVLYHRQFQLWPETIGNVLK